MAVLLTLSPAASALTDLSPYATVGVEHNSNVFARPAGEPPFADTGNTQLGTLSVSGATWPILMAPIKCAWMSSLNRCAG